MAEKKRNNSSFKRNLTAGFIVMLVMLVVLNIQFASLNNTINEMTSMLSTGESDVAGSQDQVQQQPEGVDIEEELLDLPDVVATVNGEDITKEEFVTFKSQTGMTDDEQVVDYLITRMLLMEEAQSRGIEVSVDDVEASFVEQGIPLDEIKSQIEMQGMDYSFFLDAQREEMILMELLDREQAKIEITDEDALTFYEQEKDSFDPNATYEDMEMDIKFYLAEIEAGDKLMELVEQEKEESDIQIFI